MSGAVARRGAYRLQLTPSFGFAAAEAQLPHLATLGVSHLYLSPVLQAQRGSTHGYDVTDHLQVSEDLGGEVAFASLCASTRAAGLALLIDIVPNHMAVATPANRWWMDVLDDELARLDDDVDALDALLGAQQHRLASWRVSGRELYYRRSFDVDDLVGATTGRSTGPRGTRGRCSRPTSSRRSRSRW